MDYEKKGWGSGDQLSFAKGVSGGNKPGQKWDILGWITSLLSSKDRPTKESIYNNNETDGTFTYKNLAKGLNSALGGSSKDYTAPSKLLDWSATNGMLLEDRRYLENAPPSVQETFLINAKARNMLKNKR